MNSTENKHLGQNLGQDFRRWFGLVGGDFFFWAVQAGGVCWF